MTSEHQLDDNVKELVKQHGIKAVKDSINKTEKHEDEPILDPKNSQFTAYPIRYPTVHKLYKEQIACMWKAEEIDFSNDYEDFQTLNENEKHFIEMILAFFAASDGIVNFNLTERFTREVQPQEIITAYQFQIMMENIHSEVYSLMLENIVRDTDKRNRMFNAITTEPSIKMMADWAFKWIDSSESFAHRVVAFAIVEGVFFSGAFASIFWLKKYKQNTQTGKPFMNGLVTSNKFISRDEGLHCNFACEIYSLLNNRLEQHVVADIMSEAVDIAKQFITVSISVNLIGMNSGMMCEYIEYVSDRLLSMLKHDKIYETRNPFDFMNTIGLGDKTNFFDLRPHEYQDAHVMNESKKEINISEDF